MGRSAVSFSFLRLLFVAVEKRDIPVVSFSPSWAMFCALASGAGLFVDMSNVLIPLVTQKFLGNQGSDI